MERCKLHARELCLGVCGRPLSVTHRSLRAKRANGHKFYGKLLLPQSHGSPAAIRRMRCCSKHSSCCCYSSRRSVSAVPASDDKIEAIIAEVLKEHRAKIQRPADLFALLDSAGHGLSTTVNRSWTTIGVQLALQGVWQGGPQARKMAMLAVYQERLVSRAAALLQLLRYVSAALPGVLEAAVVQQVEAAAAHANPVNPAVEGLAVPQLTQLAAACYPWYVLSKVLEGATQQARQALFKKPPYSYSEARKQAAQQQLMFVEASLARGAAWARLRVLLQQQGQLQQLQQQAVAATAGLGKGQVLLTPEQTYYEAWKQQRQQQQQQQDWALHQDIAAAAASRGRSMSLNFHSRSDKFPYLLQSSPGTVAASPAAAAAAAVDEVHQLCVVLQNLTAVAQRLRQGLAGGSASTLGVLPEVQRCYRAALLELCIAWSESCPGVKQPVQAAVAAAKVAVSSVEHDRLLRRIGLEASGAELPVLRQLAVSKGKDFLQYFSPSVGNPFAATEEWDYFRDCPGVFTRFVEDPLTQQATLSFKPGTGQQHAGQPEEQQQQQQDGPVSSHPAVAASSTQLQLSQSELQQLLEQLVLVLSGSSSSSSAAAAALGGTRVPADRQIILRPFNNSSSSSDLLSKQAAVPGPQLQLLIDGVAAAELTAVHVTSLVTVMEDLMQQLPGQYKTTPAAVQIVPAPPLHQAVTAAVGWLASSSRALAAAALLALPLLAIARPFRTLQLMPTAAAATATVMVKDASPATGSAQGSTAPVTYSRRVQPVTQQLPSDELQQLCAMVQHQLQGKIWLPDSLPFMTRLLSSTDAAGQQTSSSAVPSTQPNSSSSSQLSQHAGAVSSDDELVFQVVVDRQGHVLGFKPCTAAAAAVFLEVPLAAALRGEKLAQAQARRCAIITTADLAAAKPAKQAPRLCHSKVAHTAVQQQQLPADGAVVLKLQLLLPQAMPSTVNQGLIIGNADSAHVAATPQGESCLSAQGAAAQAMQFVEQQQQGAQRQQQAVCKTVGSSKAAVKVWLMAPVVSAWCDADSLEAWSRGGALMQQQQQQQQLLKSVLAEPGSSSSSSSSTSQLAQPSGNNMSVSVDGQRVDTSWEVLLQQLLAAAREQDGAAAAGSHDGTAAAPGSEGR